MAIETLERTTQWPARAETTVPSAIPHDHPQAQGDPRDALPQSLAAVRAEDAPTRLSIHGVLAQWRAAERALAELPEGSPEWAAVNATAISLRSAYRTRFDECVAGASRETEGEGWRAWER
jgi:hypothetical protein